jgi:hypothetical protein
MSTEHENESNKEGHGFDRRNFLKLSLAGAAAVAAAATGVTITKRLEGLPHDEFPLPVNDDYERTDFLGSGQDGWFAASGGGLTRILRRNWGTV